MSDDDEISAPAPPDMAWLLTFADLVSLLITFFVLLFSMKTVDQQVWEAVKGSFDGVFSVTKPILHITPDQDASIARIEMAEADNLDYLQNILTVRFKMNKVLRSTQMYRDAEKDTLTLVLPTTLLFKPGSATLKAEGVEAMFHLADQLRHFDNTLEIAGHTDPSPINSKTYPSNWELAMLRAIRVVELLQEQGIIQEIPAVSFGDSRYPLVSPALPPTERFSRARRVEVIIKGKS